MLIEQFARDRYATAVLADLDLDGGLLSWINCGHPAPILIREGRWISALERSTEPPLGHQSRPARARSPRTTGTG
ncbi:SpoIIE family protein phosphatase [Streptomyces sp. NPDC054797]